MIGCDATDNQMLHWSLFLDHSNPIKHLQSINEDKYCPDSEILLDIKIIFSIKITRTWQVSGLQFTKNWINSETFETQNVFNCWSLSNMIVW